MIEVHRADVVWPHAVIGLMQDIRRCRKLLVRDTKSNRRSADVANDAAAFAAAVAARLMPAAPSCRARSPPTPTAGVPAAKAPVTPPLAATSGSRRGGAKPPASTPSAPAGGSPTKPPASRRHRPGGVGAGGGGSSAVRWPACRRSINSRAVRSAACYQDGQGHPRAGGRSPRLSKRAKAARSAEF